MTHILHGDPVIRYGPNHPGEDLTWKNKEGQECSEDVKATSKISPSGRSRLTKTQRDRKKQVEKSGGIYVEKQVYIPSSLLGIKETLKDINKGTQGRARKR